VSGHSHPYSIQTKPFRLKITQKKQNGITFKTGNEATKNGSFSDESLPDGAAGL